MFSENATAFPWTKKINKTKNAWSFKPYPSIKSLVWSIQTQIK
jgi:hypothetical protein